MLQLRCLCIKRKTSSFPVLVLQVLYTKRLTKLLERWDQYLYMFRNSHKLSVEQKPGSTFLQKHCFRCSTDFVNYHPQGTVFSTTLRRKVFLTKWPTFLYIIYFDLSCIGRYICKEYDWSDCAEFCVPYIRQNLHLLVQNSVFTLLAHASPHASAVKGQMKS